MRYRALVAAGRDNNLNLIRVLAALAVMVSHTWPIMLGEGRVEPMQRMVGQSLGTMAVYVFFGISGFLISASYARNPTASHFIGSRLVRLYPGLLVSLIIVALVIGPLVTSDPVENYLGNPETWWFFLSNLTLVVPQYVLPGVFTDSPFPVVEGSIWSLGHEVGWYFVLLGLALAGVLHRRWAMIGVLAAAAALWALPGMAEVQIHPKVVLFLTMGVPFVMGMALWSWRRAVPASVAIIAALALATAATLTVPGGFIVMMAFVVYTTFWLAYVPSGPLRAYNRLGDYSYGIYIYAFPVQGLITHWFAPQTVALHLALAVPPTLLLAVLSWHLVEYPAQRLWAGRSASGPRQGGAMIVAAQAMTAPILAVPLSGTGRPFRSTE